MNEQAVGKAIKNAGVNRQKLFVTTKLWVQDHVYENTIASIERQIYALEENIHFSNIISMV